MFSYYLHTASRPSLIHIDDRRCMVHILPEHYSFSYGRPVIGAPLLEIFGLGVSRRELRHDDQLTGEVAEPYKPVITPGDARTPNSENGN